MAGDHDRSAGDRARSSEPATPAAEAAARTSPFSELDAGPPAADAGPAPVAAAQADVLSNVLDAVTLTGALFFFVDAAPPWVSAAPDAPTLLPTILPGAQHLVSYHVVTEGTCWCSIAGEPAIRLDPGDAIVVPHGHAYQLASAPGMSARFTIDEMLGWFGAMAAGAMPYVVEEGEGVTPGSLRLICGFLGCDARPFNPVLATLPTLYRIAKPMQGGDGLRALIDLAAAESRSPRAGSRTVLLKLAELMFVEVVRRHLLSPPDDARGWLAGLRDPLVGRALAMLHNRPAQAWTLDALARELAVSRSVLTERFTRLVGLGPIHYLTQWRMQLAARRLVDGDAKVSAVGRELGYDSDAAFSRAFKKATGLAPAAWRRR